MTVLVMHGTTMEFATLRSRVLAASRRGAVVAVAIIKVVVNVTVEAARAVEPGACADKDAAVEPFRAVVAIRCAGVRGSFIVAVRAFRSWADLN